MNAPAHKPSPPPEDGSRPVSARLARRPREVRATRVRAAWTKALAVAFSVHLLIATVFGTFSASDPWQTLWPKLALAAWAVYLWPLIRYARARRDPANRPEAIAAALDAANSKAPDVFRTLLSSGRHAPGTLDALETLYAAWEPRLTLSAASPGEEKKSRARKRIARGAPALAALFAIGFPFWIAHSARDRFPGGAAEIFERAWLPVRALSDTPSPRLTPLDLRDEITEGDTLALRVRADYVSPRRSVYVHVIGDNEETRYEMDRPRRSTQATPGPEESGQRPESRRSWASFRVGPVTTDLELRFSTPGFTSRVYRVRKRPPPRLARLSLTVAPPAYARKPVERFAETPALITALPGSVLAWEAESAEPLSAFTTEFRLDSGKARTDGLGAGETFTFRQTLRRAFELRVRLANARGGRAAEGPFRVEPLTDAPPEIAWLDPTEDQELGRTLRLAVRFSAKDDFGISRLSLRYAVPREGGRPLSGSRDITAWLDRRADAGAGTWNAEDLGLESGDEVELWLEATDNDAVSGPKTSRTPSLRLRLPSREEARASVQAGEREAAVSLSTALERERRLRRELERPDRGASNSESQAALQSMPEWELQRILSDQPRQHVQEMKRQMEAELRRAEPSPQAAALRALRRELDAQEKRLPQPSVARAPAEEQRKALERLNKDQKALEQAVAKTPAPKVDSAAPPSAKRAAREEAANRKRLQESLRQNLKDQESLKNWMTERDRAKNVDQARSEEARKHAERMRQDMKQALDQIDKAMKKGLENGTLSPEMLEKMERVRELVEEVLGADEKQALRRSAQGPVEAEDLQRAVQDLLSKKEGVRESLESAIRMLESLKEARALRDLAADVRELEGDQKDLAARMESQEASAALAERQQALGQRLDEARGEMDRLAKQSSLSELQSQKDAPREARAAMRQAADALKKPSGGDRKAAKKGADLAAKRLQKTAEQMEKTLSKLDAPFDAAELRSALEETLEFSRWLETFGSASARGAQERRAWGDAGARQAAVRVSRWLAGRWTRLADGRPFDGDVLRRQAAAMGFEADALAALPAAQSGEEALDGLRRRAQGAARELLKWLNEDKDEGGSEEGDGEGDSDASGGNSGEAKSEGLSGRMKGAAARQNAVNQATQDLLQSFLRQRRQSRGAPSGEGGEGGGSGHEGGSPGQGRMPSPRGSGSASGSGSEPGEGEGSRGSPGGEGEGGEGQGGSQGGQGSSDARALANLQQQIAEALEQWAESADDAGGSARKLRQLAAEARDLEAELRGRRLDPEEVRRRQERFRTRLLEAANAMEERGRERERRAEAYKGGAVAPPEAESALRDEEWLRVLKRRRDEARRLPLTPAQKRQVEWYYDQLLNP